MSIVHVVLNKIFIFYLIENKISIKWSESENNDFSLWDIAKVMNGVFGWDGSWRLTGQNTIGTPIKTKMMHLPRWLLALVLSSPDYYPGSICDMFSLTIWMVKSIGIHFFLEFFLNHFLMMLYQHVTNIGYICDNNS